MNRTKGRISQSSSSEGIREAGTILVLGARGASYSDPAAVLGDDGFHVVQAGSTEECARILPEEYADLILVLAVLHLHDRDGNHETVETARGLARRHGAGVLHLLPEPIDCEGLLGAIAETEDWISLEATAAELRCRVQASIHRLALSGNEKSVWIPGADFLPMLVHDLRSPLNVIGLSMQMLPPSITNGDPELENDLRMMRENFEYLARKLTLLEDFHRLLRPQGEEGGLGFSPTVLIDEVVQEVLRATHPRPFTVAVDAQNTSPPFVELDPWRARLGLHYALTNAGRAAEGGEVRLISRGEGSRWVVEIGVDLPPTDTVRSGPLFPDQFERIVGVARERRGMDLSIVARVSESLGGRARLETVPGLSTAIVLEWPATFRSPPLGAK